MAVGVNIVSDFDAKGIRKAISDFQKLEGAGNKATFGLRTLDSAVTNGVKNLAKMGAVVGGVAGVIGFKLASAAYESQKALAQTEAIIKSTGGAANISGKQVSELSEKLSMQIGVDDELIQKSANLLLTFKQVQNQVGANNDIFNQAVTLSQDLGNVFGSAEAAAMQLGKALSDPEKGITALRRAGINFTESQKEQIRTLVASGDVLSAQKLILAEVESQVGGTAAATATSFDIMRVAVGNVAENFGALLIPVIERFAKFVTEKVVPYLNRLAEVIGEEGIGAGIRMLAGGFLDMTTNMGKFGNIMLVLIAAFTAFRLVAIAATIAQVAFDTALLQNPIGIVIAAFIAIGVAVVAAYLKFETFRKVVHAVINFVIGLVEDLVNAFIDLYNKFVFVVNVMIKAANLFGAGLTELSYTSHISFGRIASDAQKASAQIFKTLDAIQAVKNAERSGSFLTPTVSGSGGDDEFGGGGGGKAAKAVETVTEKLKKYIDAIKGVTQAQRSARDATKQVLEANTALSEATQKLSLAQENFNQIIRGYGQNSKQANDKQKLLAKAQRTLEKSGYDVEASIFAVKKAEQKLAETRADPKSNPVDIREAEIALAEAKLNVSDATDSQAEATNSLTNAEMMLDEAVNGAKVGSDAYAEALEKVNEAKAAQVNASDKVIDALEREKDAVEKLADAEEKRREAGKGLPAQLKKTADAAAEVISVVSSAVTAVPAVIAAVPAVAEAIVATIASVFPPSAEQQAFQAGRLTADQASALEGRRGGVFPFASGGIVTKPMMGLVGESGAEAIIPLDRLGNMGNTYNIQVTAGMGADGKDIGTQIVNALKRYERTNGAIPITVA